MDWSAADVAALLAKEGLPSEAVDLLCSQHLMDGKCLLALTEADFGLEPLVGLRLRDRKRLLVLARALQRDNAGELLRMGLAELPAPFQAHSCPEYCDSERLSPTVSEDGRASRLSPEIGKAFISFCYVVVVTWVTAFAMVVVHDRVPDMKKYPPLPDIFLDNVPHIPWAFDMCEVTGTILFSIWMVVLLFHKHRFILLRRFFALSGTVFFLRCVTMLITSLSVPGTHLQCEPRASLNDACHFYEYFVQKVSQAFIIWRAGGMSIRGVRTCGDYMFSGHTVALTMLNFFITEYTPRNLYYLHTLTWVMNMFGIFFILAAHEHYSIDVFVAFYITSRLFLYYHTLSNNQSLMQRDSTRTRIWFPMFSFFENSVDGIVPNEFDRPADLARNLFNWLRSNVDAVIKKMTGRGNCEIVASSKKQQ